MALFDILYGRKCKSPIGWFKVGKMALLGPDLVIDAMEKMRLIREKLKMTQSRQKSYFDVRRWDLEFNIVDWVYLKMSIMKGAI